MNLTAQAHELHRSGFSVLAMDSEKRPVVRTWKHFKQRAQSPHEITRMFAHPRATSVAIILPDGTVHVEADTAEGTQHIEAHGIPRGTPVLDSPRGIHCTWAGALSGPGVKAESGLDALGAGRLAIVPNSPGRHYRPESPPLVLDQLPPMPEWLTDLVRDQPDESKPSTDEMKRTEQELGVYLSDPVVVARVLPLLGIRSAAMSGKSVRCVLPGHGADRHPSASVWSGTNGNYFYHDWHTKDGEEIFLLAEVFAARVSGTVRHLSPIQRALWGRRLLVRAGVLRLAGVVIPSPPEGIRSSTRRAHEGILELFGVRWQFAPGEAIPLSWRFVASWCGMGERQAGEAMHELLRLGIIHIVGTIQLGHRPTAVFMPGPGVSRARRTNGFPTPLPIGNPRQCYFSTREARPEGVVAPTAADSADRPSSASGDDYLTRLHGRFAHLTSRRPSGTFRLPSPRDLKRQLRRAERLAREWGPKLVSADRIEGKHWVPLHALPDRDSGLQRTAGHSVHKKKGGNNDGACSGTC